MKIKLVETKYCVRKIITVICAICAKGFLNSNYAMIKGALDNILKLSFLLNFIYRGNLQIQKQKKSKNPSEREEIITFC